MTDSDVPIGRRHFLRDAGMAVGLTATFRPASAAAGQVTAPAEGVNGADGLSIIDFGAGADARAAQNSAAFIRAFDRYSASRTHQVGPDSYWGIGRFRLPRGSLAFEPIQFGARSQAGMEIGGTSAFASAMRFDISAGAAFTFKAYLALHVHDLLLKNYNPRAGSSVGINLDGEGGGALLSLKRLVIEGFGTAIAVQGQGVTPGNGDKTLVEQCLFHTDVGFDQTRNKQAYGWTFLNCAGGCSEAEFKMGGAGEVLIANYIGNPFGAFLKFPESSGNAGTGGRPNYLGQRITVMSTKLEYHGQGPRMLIDARASRLLTDSGGSNCDIVLREVSIASGANWPDPATHVIMQVGDDRSGSDAIRVKQEGGWIEGVVKLGSAQLGRHNRRWSFRDAVRAPDPETVQFLGAGSHYLLEWRANENVPVDQYRGGEAFIGSIDAQKAFLWRQSGRSLINTGIAARELAGRRGEDFVIGGLPRKMTVTGLAVFIDRNRRGSDTRVEWFADRSFRQLLGAATIAGDRVGLQPVVMNDPAKWQTVGRGELYVRITKPALHDDGTEGALVIFYFPYMGS